jgi:hypothetical protein
MLIAPHGLKLDLRATVDLTREQAQLFLDFETFCVSMGLAMAWVRCLPCARACDPKAMCEGEARPFKLECGCTTRQYLPNDLTAPLSPRYARRERLEDGSKREETLTRDQYRTVLAFETMLGALKLQYALNCLHCQNSAESAGIFGVHDGVMECGCTRRTLPTLDAAVAAH